jgi:hypothetical protein
MPNRNRADQPIAPGSEATAPTPPITADALRGKGRFDEILDRTLSDIHLQRGDSVRTARNAHLDRVSSGNFTPPASRKR